MEEEATMQLKPVSLQLGTAERVGFEVQKLSDGRSMVFIPSVPNMWSGITQILPADQITDLDAPFTSVMELSERYGLGAEELISKKIEPAPSTIAPEKA